MACEWVAEVVLQLSQISRVVGDGGGGGGGRVAFCGEFGGDGGLDVSLSALLTPRGVGRVAFRTLPVNAEYCFLPCPASSSTVCPAASVELGRRNGSLAESRWILETKFGNLQSVFSPHDLAHRSGW